MTARGRQTTSPLTLLRHRARFVLAFLAASLIPAVPALACASLSGPSVPASLTGLTAEGDLALSDGTTARLVGIRLAPAEATSEAVAAALYPWLEHSGAALMLAAPEPDRWGRRMVAVASPYGNHPDSLGLTLVRKGLAIAWTPDLPPDCRNAYLHAEQEARNERIGRWADASRGLLDASDGERAVTLAGEIAIMQGLVAHVGQTRAATYLNFGARGVGASAEIRVATWRLLERQGLTTANLRGRNVRVRGVMTEGNPARLVVSHPGLIEVLD
jgi:endonuclease YncB( thermonuclease family)